MVRKVIERTGGRCELHISEYTFLYSCDFQNQVNIPHIKYIKLIKCVRGGILKWNPNRNKFDCISNK